LNPDNPGEEATVIGFEVDPNVLREGAPKVYRASDQVGTAAALVSGVQINAQALGNVPAAGDFAAAFGEFVSAHGADLVHGSVWINDAADGLAKSADAYHRAEQEGVAGVRKAGG
jgi:hypothetical protein